MVYRGGEDEQHRLGEDAVRRKKVPNEDPMLYTPGGRRADALARFMHLLETVDSHPETTTVDGASDDEKTMYRASKLPRMVSRLRQIYLPAEIWAKILKLLVDPNDMKASLRRVATASKLPVLREPSREVRVQYEKDVIHALAAFYDEKNSIMELPEGHYLHELEKPFQQRSDDFLYACKLVFLRREPAQTFIYQFSLAFPKKRHFLGCRHSKEEFYEMVVEDAKVRCVQVHNFHAYLVYLCRCALFMLMRLRHLMNRFEALPQLTESDVMRMDRLRRADVGLRKYNSLRLLLLTQESWDRSLKPFHGLRHQVVRGQDFDLLELKEGDVSPRGGFTDVRPAADTLPVLSLA